MRKYYVEMVHIDLKRAKVRVMYVGTEDKEQRSKLCRRYPLPLLTLREVSKRRYRSYLIIQKRPPKWQLTSLKR